MFRLFERGWAERLCGSAAVLICILCLTACGGARAGGGRELPTQREHNGFKAMILSQPEFSEEELLEFSADLASASSISEEDLVEYLESVHGWSKHRHNYMIFKMGLVSESILARKSYAALFPVIPAELYPTRLETALVRKHRDLILPLFMPQGIRSTPGETSGQP